MKMIYDDRSIPVAPPSRDEFMNVARLVHEQRERGQALAGDLIHEASLRYHNDVLFHRRVLMAVSIVDSERPRVENDLQALRLSAALALLLAEKDENGDPHPA